MSDEASVHDRLMSIFEAVWERQYPEAEIARLDAATRDHITAGETVAESWQQYKNRRESTLCLAAALAPEGDAKTSLENEIEERGLNERYDALRHLLTSETP